jgi:hypothetical protein
MSNSYDFPRRREYNLNVSIEIMSWEKVETIKKVVSYKQANIIETIKELDEMDEIWLDTYFVKFLKEHSWLDENDLILLWMQPEKIEDLMIKFLTTRFRWVINEDAIKKPKNGIMQKSWVPYSAILVLLSKKLCIDPITFQEKYTFEQMTYLLAGIEYWANTKSEKWQKANKEKYEKDINYDSMLIEQLKRV